MKVAIFIAVALGMMALVFFQTKPTLSFVPQPIEGINLAVTENNIYPFPWTGTENQCDSFTSGCFRVEKTDNQKVIIYYERFSITDGELKPSGLFLRQEVLTTGTREAIFNIEQNPPNQLWVYAVYSPQNKELRFLQLPAQVTRKAKIYRTMVLDFTKRSLWEKTKVEADEPVTLIESGAVEKAIPDSFLSSLKINDQKFSFLFPTITNINFPEGINYIETEINWEDSKTTVCPWSFYEGRKMSLPIETELTIRNDKPIPLSVSLSSFGIPEEVWRDYDILLGADPTPVFTEKQTLSKILRFSAADELTIKIKPVILYQDATFTVIICVEKDK